MKSTSILGSHVSSNLVINLVTPRLPDSFSTRDYILDDPLPNQLPTDLLVWEGFWQKCQRLQNMDAIIELNRLFNEHPPFFSVSCQVLHCHKFLKCHTTQYIVVLYNVVLYNELMTS